MVPLKPRFLQLLAAAATATKEFTSAFVPAPTVSITPRDDCRAVPFVVPAPASNCAFKSRRTSRSLHVLESAKIVPYAFRSASAALAVKGVQTLVSSSSTGTDALVVLSTALMGFFNFATKDNARLVSAKKASKGLQSENDDSEEPESTTTTAWVLSVRVKIVGQFLGMLWMLNARTFQQIMLSAAAVVSSTILFLLLGGGRFQHNANGKLNPIPPAMLQKIYKLDTSIVVAAVVAASLPLSFGRTCLAGYVVFGFFGAAMQGMAPSSKAKKELNKVVFGNTHTKKQQQ